MKILVVDDDANICELLRLYLEKEGFEVIVAHNGSKALEHFSNEKIDFVILDITYAGHQYLNSVRDPGVWGKLKSTAKSLTFSVVTQAAEKILLANIGV